MNEICPICSKENHCGSNNTNVDCWCTKVSFPSMDVEKLNLPDVCICPNCVDKLKKPVKKQAL